MVEAGVGQWAAQFDGPQGPDADAGPARTALALHLSQDGLSDLADTDTRGALKDLIRQSNLSILGGVVDADGLTGWDRPHRAARAIALAELLADLNPQGRLITLTSSLEPDGDDRTNMRAAAYLLRFAAFCCDLRLQTRRDVRLCLHNVGGTGAGYIAAITEFVGRHLHSDNGIRQLAGLSGLTRPTAKDFLHRFFRVSDDPQTGVMVPMVAFPCIPTIETENLGAAQ